MHRRHAVVVLIALLLPRLVAAQASPLVGVWILDVPASSSTGGMPDASTLTISESTPGTLKFEIQDTFDGRPQPPYAFLSGPAGSEVAVSPATFIDSVATTRREQRFSSLVLKKAGTVVSEMSTELSDDGSTLTVKSKATAPNGDTVSGTSLYRRSRS